MAIIKILATISFTVDPEHPDIKYMENPDGIHTFTDCYHFDTEKLWCTDREELHAIIEDDLKLVAGGGYNYDHIHNVTFDFTENSNKINAWGKALKED